MAGNTDPLVSVVVLTYNWPPCLFMVLTCLSRQSWKNYEVIVADDGSDAETQRCVELFMPTYPVPLRYVRQERIGIRIPRARNLGAMSAKGDFLIFLDGDCLVPRHWIATRARLGGRGIVLGGRRYQASRHQTNAIIKGRIDPYVLPAPLMWAVLRVTGRHPILVTLPWRRPPDSARIPKDPKRTPIIGFDITVWRDDFVKVGGFDETYIGWGSDDSDLTVRLVNAGCRPMLALNDAPVIHFAHDRAPPALDSKERLASVRASNRTLAGKSMFLDQGHQ